MVVYFLWASFICQCQKYFRLRKKPSQKTFRPQLKNTHPAPPEKDSLSQEALRRCSVMAGTEELKFKGKTPLVSFYVVTRAVIYSRAVNVAKTNLGSRRMDVFLLEDFSSVKTICRLRAYTAEPLDKMIRGPLQLLNTSASPEWHRNYHVTENYRLGFRNRSEGSCRRRLPRCWIQSWLQDVIQRLSLNLAQLWVDMS